MIDPLVYRYLTALGCTRPDRSLALALIGTWDAVEARDLRAAFARLTICLAILRHNGIVNVLEIAR